MPLFSNTRKLDPIEEFTVVEPRCEVQRASPSLDTPENRLFGNFFSNIDECRTLMEGTRVLASGSAVLHALQPATWRPPNLDLFASEKSLRNLGLGYWDTYFLKEGYKLLEPHSASGLDLSIFTYVNAQRNIQVQFIKLPMEPLHYLMLNPRSTALMNIATWKSIYCLFPVSTLDNRHMVTIKITTHAELEAHNKYLQRGYTDVHYEDVSGLGEFQSKRTVGDKWTRRVLFSGEDAEPEPNVSQTDFFITQEGVTMFQTNEVATLTIRSEFDRTHKTR